MNRNSTVPARWTSTGHSRTSPIEQTTRKTVVIDSYYVVVGFEVNKPEAFVDETHDLAVDYGHAFFYTVKNNTIISVFSFGPNGAGKFGWFDKGSTFPPNKYNRYAPLKDGYTNSRPGTPDFIVTETVKAFQLRISLAQAMRLIHETNKIRAEVISGELRYHAFLNDTCAETAKEILDEVEIDNPSGSGAVKHSKALPFSIAYSVNPYAWYFNFIKNGYKAKIFNPGPARRWLPLINKLDPIYGTIQK
ncbi:hypothetical protein IM543_01165 [Massilia sp. UMI-21]|nr:hypothetical protein IM543_01165 [Massilia sp. UMI-21]